MNREAKPLLESSLLTGEIDHILEHVSFLRYFHLLIRLIFKV